MLTITDTAAEAVRQLAANSGLGPDPGVRIAPGMPTQSGTPLELSLAGGPEASDQTVEADGATVYVEGHVTELLDDKVLDASIDGGQVRFAIHDM
jgi:Fe-S cluster assembly iron-binding protein IscA